MFYDLNVVYNRSTSDLQATLNFAAELGYDTIALTDLITGKLPVNLSEKPIPNPPPGINVPKNIKLLTRATFMVSDPSQNHRLQELHSAYDLLALRPTTEKAFSLCCHSLDCDLISLDLSARLPFILKFKALSSALQRGIRFEICYSPGVTGGATDARRNLISGATALIRASRGKGIIISSEARHAIGLRGPFDAINLCTVWGLGQEKGKEGVCEEARKVVAIARMKRTSFRGVVDIINGGQKDTADDHPSSTTAAEGKAGPLGTKRKIIEDAPDEISQSRESVSGSKPMSKKEAKRQAKKAKLAAQKT